MSTTLPMKEVGNLISSPEFPNAVQWAADGTLAVAEGNGITLLNPSALNGPRSFCAVEAFAKDTIVEAAGVVLNANQASSIHYDLAMSSTILSSAGGKDTLGLESSSGREKKDSNSQSKKSQVAPRAIAWSPPGAGPFGSSLLATVLTDHRIIVYGPQRGVSPEWKELVSLHDDVLNYMANESVVLSCHALSSAPSPSPEDPQTYNPQPQKPQPCDTHPENVESVQVLFEELEEEPTEQAGLVTDPSPEPLTKQQAALKTVSMFFKLRRNLPASEIPVYPTPSSHLKDGDLNCLKRAMDAVWTQHCSLSFKAAGVTRKMFELESRYQLRLAWDRYNNVAREGYEEVVGLQGPGGSSSRPASDKAEKEDGETTESEDEEIVVYARNTRNGHRRSQTANVPEPKRLVSWLDLPPVTPQSAGDYKRTLISGAVKRFLLVRANSEEPAVRYRSSSQHLKAEDVTLLEGVVEEYAEAFAEAFVSLNLDKATFQQLVTVQLRKMWNRVTGKYIPPDLNVQETARDILGITASNENDGPPVVPILKGASHGLSGGGVRGRGGGRGKAREGGGQQTFERADQLANRLCTSAPDYERRLLSLSSISCAWSPVLNDEIGLAFSLLAVGTKEGRVWLWRYCHGRNDASADEFNDHFGDRFRFLGCCCSPSLDVLSGAEGLKPRKSVPRDIAWSSALDWVRMTGEHGVKPESVILVVGRSDGSVALLMCKVPDLEGNVQINRNVFQQLDTVALGSKGETKALQAVTCVCAKVVCGGTRLVVAVAGAMGIVSLWVGALTRGQECVLVDQEHMYSCPWFVESASVRYSAVTGLCMTHPPETDDDDSQALLILACNREGSLACWSLPCDKIQSLQGSVDGCEGPVACFKRVKPYREVGFGTFGIAASPGGGFVATARCALPKGIDIIKQLQVWQRLTLGYVQLYRTIGPSSARPDALRALKACCEGWACRPTGPLPWDIVNVGIKALGVDPEPLAALWESALLKSLDQCRMPLSIPDTTWRLLMSAVALRHASGSSPNIKEGGLASNKYELLLLQRQTEKVMVSEDCSFSKFSKLAAAEFVLCLYSGSASSQQYIELERPFLDLVPLAREVHREVTGRAVPAGDFQPAWKEIGGLECVESKTSNGSFTSAVITAAVRMVGHSNREQGHDEEVTMVPLCPASFLPVVGSRPFSCRLCLRTYAMQVPCCVVCGFAVGLSGPDFLFLPP